MLRPGVNVTLRPARCIRTEPDVALFAVLMESWEPPWEESWRPSGESLRAERARLLGILNTSNADKKHSLSSYSLFRNVPPPHLTPSLLRVYNSPRSRQFPVCALHASPMCRWGCRCVALRESLCFICYHAPSPHVYSNNWSCFGWGLIVFPVKLFWGLFFFFPTVWIHCGRTLENGADTGLVIKRLFVSLSVRNWTGSNWCSCFYLTWAGTEIQDDEGKRQVQKSFWKSQHFFFHHLIYDTIWTVKTRYIEEQGSQTAFIFVTDQVKDGKSESGTASGPFSE